MSERINQLIEENIFENKCAWFSFVNNKLTEGNHGSTPHLRVLDSNGDYQELPDYFGNISEAFRVMEKMQLTLTPSYSGWKVFRSNSSGFSRESSWIGTTNKQRWIESERAPEAICLAALKLLRLDSEITKEELI